MGMNYHWIVRGSNTINIIIIDYKNTIFYKFFGERKIEFVSVRQKFIDSHTYEWKTHGYSILDEYFPDIARNIDLKYDYIHNLTLGS